ncbi:MAG: hypothetical protein Q8K85_18145, partial [Hyphomicrobium sp.]|nr:hypothetical protein [Hyphomicrobium sp.]
PVSAAPYPRGPDDVLIVGRSSFPCYEPMFGYVGQNAPAAGIGPIGFDSAGLSNVIDPTCLVFGEANQCRPGDRFGKANSEQLARFLSYRAHEFIEPWWQKLAKLVSAVTLIGVLLGFAALAAIRLNTRKLDPAH